MRGANKEAHHAKRVSGAASRTCIGCEEGGPLQGTRAVDWLRHSLGGLPFRSFQKRHGPSEILA